MRALPTQADPVAFSLCAAEHAALQLVERIVTARARLGAGQVEAAGNAAHDANAIAQALTNNLALAFGALADLQFSTEAA